MLVVLMALKKLELRARRDALVVFFLGFSCPDHFSIAEPGHVVVLVAVWGLLTALVLAHMRGRPPLRRAAGGVGAHGGWGCR